MPCLGKCLNVLADSLSRFKPLSAEWQLDPTLFSHLHQLLTTLSVDLFIACHNTQLTRFLSPFPDKSAVGVETLSHPWEFLGVMYTFLRFVTRQDSRLVAAGPSASAGVSHTTVVQFFHRTGSHACGTSPSRPVSPPAGELDSPVITDVHPTRLDTLQASYRGIAGILCMRC